MLYESIDTNPSGTKTLTEGVRAQPHRRRALTRRGGISGLLIFVPVAAADEGAIDGVDHTNHGFLLSKP